MVHIPRDWVLGIGIEWRNSLKMKRNEAPVRVTVSTQTVADTVTSTKTHELGFCKYGE